MAEPDVPSQPSPISDPDSLDLIEQAAKSLKRMKADEGFDEKGVRTIWHRGRQRTEMLSWENNEEIILRQELSFFGMVVEYRKGALVRTGTIPVDDDTTAGKQMSAMVKYEVEPAAVTLDYASHLLKNVQGRDFYAQHLLKHVNSTIAATGFDDARTSVSVSNLNKFGRIREPRDNEVSPSRGTGAPAGALRFWLTAMALALAGLAVGAGIAIFLTQG